MRFMRVSAVVVGIAGLLLFASAFIASFVVPGFVEQAAREVIRFEVEKQVHEKIEALDDSFLGRQAAKLSGRYAERMADSKRLLEANAPERIAQVIGEMRNLSCECRNKVAATLRASLTEGIQSDTEAQAQLTAFIRTKYMDTADHVTREFRIFTGTNAAVFAMLLIAVLVRRSAGMHLVPATVVLLISAGITGYLYLFRQDWLHTLLFNDYVGFGYLAYLAAVFALLCDIVFNRARVTVQILNLFFSALGNAVVAVPC
jgi:hypothetical protein